MSNKRPTSPGSPRPSTPPSSPPHLKRKTQSSKRFKQWLDINNSPLETCTKCKGLIKPVTCMRRISFDNTSEKTLPKQDGSIPATHDPKPEPAAITESTRQNTMICWCHLSNTCYPIPFRINAFALAVEPSEIYKLNLIGNGDTGGNTSLEK
jgi:hypothetical protein